MTKQQVFSGSEAEILGLSKTEVAEKIAAKQVNTVTSKASRSVTTIISANVFTFFNLLLIACVIVTFCFGSWKDTVFGVVLIVNSLTGIISEIRAKLTLDRMSILDTAPIEVVREGKTCSIPPDQIVLGEIIKLKIGDQVPVDGEVLLSQGLRLDESNLTGESVPQLKDSGEKVMSGSAVVSGRGIIKAQAVGAESWANQMSAQVKKFVLARSELQEGIFKILRVITWILPLMILLLFTAQVRYYGGISALWQNHFNAAVVAIVAAIVGMIPQGLVLLTSVNFATAAMKLARRGVLVQELPAVEVLARVDMLCLDKTGTLTTGEIEARGYIPLSAEAYENIELENNRATTPANLVDDSSHISAAKPATSSLQSDRAFFQSGIKDLSDLAPEVLQVLWQLNQDKDNATAAAIAGAVEKYLPSLPKSELSQAARIVPFDSARKWSAVCYPEQAWILGAPEMVLGYLPEVAESYAQEGARILVIARVNQVLVNDGDPGWENSFFPLDRAKSPQLPAGIVPFACLVLAEELRDDARETLAYFQQQGVEVTIISGDNPVTVGALSKRAGIALPQATTSSALVPDPSLTSDPTQVATAAQVSQEKESVEYDARYLPTDLAGIKAVLASKRVFGRVSPEQKRLLVQALQDMGKTVAMTGDGVNDALALKDADLGIAMGNAASATKAASKLVLINSKFSSLPAVLLEGRRVLSNMERVSTLFLSKTVYAVVLALAVGALGIAYPYLPRHLTLIGSATIGIPAFILALAPSKRKYRPGFLKRVGQLVIPAGIVCASASIFAYLLTGGAQGKLLDNLGENSGRMFTLDSLGINLGLFEAATPVADIRMQASSVATVVLAILALGLLALLARPLYSWRGILVLVMAGIISLVLLFTPLRNFFALTWPNPAAWLVILICAGMGMIMLVAIGILWDKAHRNS